MLRFRHRNDTVLSSRSFSPAEVAAWCKDFVHHVYTKAGVHSKPYLDIHRQKWFWDPSAGGSDIVGSHPRHRRILLFPKAGPPTPCGSIPIYTGACDYSRFHGTMSELESLVGLGSNLNASCHWGEVQKQCDSRPHHIGSSSSSKTICQVGCAMSSLAMYLQSRGHAETPDTLNTFLQAHGRL